MDAATIAKLGGVISKMTVTSQKRMSRKIDEGAWDTDEAGLTLEFTLAAGANVDTVSETLGAYCDAYVARALAAPLEDMRAGPSPSSRAEKATGAVAQVTAEFPPQKDESPSDGPSDKDKAVSESPNEGDEGSDRIARFTLEYKPGGWKGFKPTTQQPKADWYELALYPFSIKNPGEPYEYAAVKFNANRQKMWEMLSDVLGQEHLDLPADQRVDWLATWTYGTLKTGPKAAPGSRYKNLQTIHSGA